MKIVCPSFKGIKLLTVFSTLILLLATLGMALPVQQAAAAAGNVPLALVYYGSHSAATDQRIIAAKPEILVGNTPGGLWRGVCNPRTFQAAGIQVYSYIDSSYGARALSSNYAYIDAIAAEGSDGIFLDQASPSATAYNQSIYNYARSKGLGVMLNPGMPYVDASIYSVADYVMTDEHYQGRAPMAVERANLSKTVVIGFGATSAQQAASWSNAAWTNGFALTWHLEIEYTALPSWLESYIPMLNGQSVAPPPATAPAINTITGTVASAPVASGGANQYNVSIRITSSSVAGVTAGQTLWVAATTTDFPNLRTVGSAVAGKLDKSLGWWVMTAATTSVTSPTTTPPTTTAPAINSITGTVASNPVATGGANQYNVSIKVTSSSVAGVIAGQTLWVATTTTDFPNLRTVGSAVAGKLDKSPGWWVMTAATTSVPPPTTTIPPPTTTIPPPTTAPAINSISGTVASAPVATGGAKQYNVSIRITSSSVAGVTAGQTLWVAATTTDFPNLKTVGSAVAGTLDKSLGWSVLSK